jgi:C4-dicarboxylate transporter DctM subunit
VFLQVAGCFLPPVAVILMTAIWFGIVLTIKIEIGLITPPVGLNLYVINGSAPDLRLPTILCGALPFVLCTVLGIVLLCLFPQIDARTARSPHRPGVLMCGGLLATRRP